MLLIINPAHATCEPGPARQRLILACATISVFMCTLDSSIVNIAMPAISRDLHVDTGLVSRISLVYLLMLTGTILLCGRLGDRFGLSRVYQAGLVIFTIGSLLCGLSRSIDALIASRCVQALGGAVMYAITPALVPRYLPPTSRGFAFGLITTAAGLGISTGAVVGGFIVAHFHWSWIFLINIPVGVIAVILVRLVLPPSPGIRDGTSFDWPGVVLLFLGLTTFLFALNRGHELGWASPRIVSALLAAAVLIPGFIFREIHTPHPLLELALFRNRTFTWANIANMFGFMLVSGTAFLLPFFLIQGHGLTSDRAGLLMLCSSGVMVACAPLAGSLADRFPARWLCAGSMVVLMLSYVYFAVYLCSRPVAVHGGVAAIILYLVFTGMGMGFFTSPNNSQILGSCDKQHQATASGVLKTLSSMGQVLGVCLFETLYAHFQSMNVAGPASDDALFRGFRAAFILAAVFALLGALASLQTRGVPAARKEISGDTTFF
jgi:EmrB/QacA subfamily drug resistance transporter